MIHTKAVIVVLSVAVLTPAASRADTITTWLGGTSTNYGASGNWSNGVANGAFTAIIPGGTPFAPITGGGNNYTLDNLTLSTAGSALTIGDNSSIIMNASGGGAITNNGSLSMNSSGNFTSLTMSGSGSVTLGGAGTLTLNDSAHDRIYANNSGITLVNNSTIQGAGQLITNGNVGTAYALTNNGTISATGGLTISTGGGTSNTGTLQAASGGTLTLMNDTFTQTGNGTILAQNGSTVNLVNATISGGTLSTTGTGNITTFSNNNATLSGAVTISSGSKLTVADQGGINLSPGASITNNGTLALSSTGNFTQLILSGAGTVTLGGTGTYMLGDNSHNRIIANVTGATLVNNSTIQGSGQMINIASVGQPYALTNNGTITASGASGLLIETAGGVANTGTLQAASGGTLQLQGETFTQTGNGTIAAQNGGLVNLVNATVVGGTLSSTGTGVLSTLTNNNVNLQNTTLTAGSKLVVADQGVLILQAGTALTNNGTISLNSSGNFTRVQLAGSPAAGTVTLSGSGVLTANADAVHNQIVASTAGMTLVNDVNHSIAGPVDFAAGSFGFAYNFINNGLVNGTSTLTNGAFTNNGTIEADAGHVFNIASTATFNNFAGNTLTGGSYLVGGTLEFANANIVNNAASITLNGAGSAITDLSSNNGLTNFANNQAAGSFSILGGRNFTTSGSFNNAGFLTVGATDIFTTGASTAYTQTGGTTQVDGALTSVGGVFVNGGTLKGSGSVNGNVTVQSGGSVSPGDSPGTLTINGNYTMASTGAFNAEFASASLFDVLNVSGTAMLNGTLNLAALAGFTPFNGEQFDIMNFASHIGTFSNVTGTNLGNGFSFSVGYNATDVVVTVNGPNNPTPEPGTWILFTLGLAGVAQYKFSARRRH